MPPCCCRPLTPPSPCHPGILLSIYSSFNVSIFAWNGSCLWLCVSKSRVPLKASCCCNFLRCLVTFCIRWDILSGPVGGWVGGQLLSCGLFLWFLLCFLLLFFYFWLQRKNSSCWFAHRSCQRNQDCVCCGMFRKLLSRDPMPTNLLGAVAPGVEYAAQRPALSHRHRQTAQIPSGDPVQGGGDSGWLGGWSRG